MSEKNYVKFKNSYLSKQSDHDNIERIIGLSFS